MGRDGQNAMGRRFDIPWIGVVKIMGRGLNIPWVVGLKYHR